jgi:hypothetical protein
MARIVFAPLVSEIKGSIGGVTFQGNPSGSIIRLRPHLSRASTTKQSAAHSSLSNLLYQWQNITSVQRDDWNTFAALWVKTNKFGQDKTLTGLNWFTSVNWWRLNIDQPLLSSPPAHTLPAAPPAFEVLITAAQLRIDFTAAHNFVTSPIAIWSSLPTKKSTLSINQIRKLVTIVNAAPADPLDITSLWETATGIDWSPSVVFPGANIFVCLESVSQSSGITSAMLCSSKYIESDTSTFYYYTS